VAISIFVHGISVTPLMSAYERHARSWSARRKATTARRAWHRSCAQATS